MHEEDKDKEENEGRGEEKLVEEEEDHEEKCAPMWTDARRDGEARALYSAGKTGKCRERGVGHVLALAFL